MNEFQDYSFADFMANLSMRANDPALLNQLKAQFPDFLPMCMNVVEFSKPRVVSASLPSPSSMTAIQTAIFDNWPGGVRAKGQPNRYGVAIEVWTAEPSLIKTFLKGNYQHKVNVSLMTGKAMAKHLKALTSTKLKKPLSAEFADYMARIIAQEMGPDDLIGIVATNAKGEGTTYHDWQFVWVPGGVRGAETELMLFVADEQMLLPKFSPFEPDGMTRLKGHVALQSRYDGAAFSRDWATGEWN